MVKVKWTLIVRWKNCWGSCSLMLTLTIVVKALTGALVYSKSQYQQCKMLLEPMHGKPADVYKMTCFLLLWSNKWQVLLHVRLQQSHSSSKNYEQRTGILLPYHFGAENNAHSREVVCIHHTTHELSTYMYKGCTKADTRFLSVNIMAYTATTAACGHIGIQFSICQTQHFRCTDSTTYILWAQCSLNPKQAPKRAKASQLTNDRQTCPLAGTYQMTKFFFMYACSSLIHHQKTVSNRWVSVAAIKVDAELNCMSAETVHS